MDPRLEYNGSYIEITGFHHETKNDIPESHFNCRFDIKVKSGMYSGYAARLNIHTRIVTEACHLRKYCFFRNIPLDFDV